MRRYTFVVTLAVLVVAGITIAEEAPDMDADGSPGAATAPRSPEAPAAAGSGRAGTVIAVTWSTSNSEVGSVDTTTGAWTAIGSSGQTRFNSLARNTSEVFYTVAWDGTSTSWLATLDVSTGTATTVATITPFIDVRGLAFDYGGTLYAVRNTTPSDELYTIDTGTGAATLIGAIGFGTVQGLAFSPVTANLYAWDNAAGLIAVDTVTGAGIDINPSVGGTGDIQTISAMPDGTMYGLRYDLYTINPGDGTYSLVAVGGYPDVRGADFTGPFPVSIQSFSVD